MGACLGTQGAVGTGLDFGIDAAKRKVDRFESGPPYCWLYSASVHYECGKDLHEMSLPRDFQPFSS